MALPRSAIPPYANASFLTPMPEGTFTRAQEIFFRYHPAVLQQSVLEATLKSATFRAQTEQQQREFLQTELSRVRDLRARYREAGVGPSGSARSQRSRSAMGEAGAAGDNLDFIEGMTRNEINRYKAATEDTIAAYKALEEYERKPRQYSVFEQDFTSYLDRKYAGGRSRPADLSLELAEKFAESQRNLAGFQDSSSEDQRRAAASDLFYSLRRRFPSIFDTSTGQLTQDALDVVMAIDGMYDTGGFLEQTLIAGEEPFRVVEDRRQEMFRFLKGDLSPGVQSFEQRGLELLGGMTAADMDTDGDGVVSERERAAARRRAMDQARRDLGIASPLTEDELVLLDRYVRALSDDGQATEAELGADFAKAKAAYDKGRRVENLPRGYAPFYDDSYLNLIAEESGLTTELGALGEPEDPFVAAALATRQDIELPQVPQEVLDQAATEGGALMADALPYAMKRFIRAGGAISPETPVERFAEKIIKTGMPGDAPISFTAYSQLVNKKYGDDPASRREALAYYGAYMNAMNIRGTTLTDAKVVADMLKEMDKNERDRRQKERDATARGRVRGARERGRGREFDAQMDSDIFGTMTLGEDRRGPRLPQGAFGSPVPTPAAPLPAPAPAPAPLTEPLPAETPASTTPSPGTSRGSRGTGGSARPFDTRSPFGPFPMDNRPVYGPERPDSRPFFGPIPAPLSTPAPTVPQPLNLPFRPEGPMPLPTTGGTSPLPGATQPLPLPTTGAQSNQILSLDFPMVYERSLRPRLGPAALPTMGGQTEPLPMTNTNLELPLPANTSEQYLSLDFPMVYERSLRPVQGPQGPNVMESELDLIIDAAGRNMGPPVNTGMMAPMTAKQRSDILMLPPETIAQKAREAGMTYENYVRMLTEGTAVRPAR